MELYCLPEHRMYWYTDNDGIFPALNFGTIMPRNRFDEILQVTQLSAHPDLNTQLLVFIDAVNAYQQVTQFA